MQPRIVTGRGHAPVEVSILIRPSGRMQLPVGAFFRPGAAPVSILIRPEGRMQLLSVGERYDLSDKFQSSSGRKAGCNSRRPLPLSVIEEFQSSSGLPAGCNLPCQQSPRRSAGFNPHPAFRPDATPVEPLRGVAHGMVSILIRPSGRMQRPGHGGIGSRHSVSILIRPSGRMQLP